VNKNLVTLAKDLNYLGYKNASKKIITISKIAQDLNLEMQQWQAVVEEAEKPVPKQIFDVAIESVINGVIGLVKSSENLKGVSEDDIKTALELGSKIPGAIKGANVNIDVIEKFASNFNKMNKTAQSSVLKGLGNLGSRALKVIPIIGFVFSAAMAIKNLIYGFIEFRKLMSISDEINMPWYETLFADKMMGRIEQNKGAPEKLIAMIKVSKSAKAFVDEAISFAANYIDFFKDIIFLIVEAIVAAGSAIIPPGWIATLGIGAVDITLSFIIMVVEYYAEKNAFEKYDIAINKIKDVAQLEIRTISLNNYDNFDDEELRNIFSN